MAKRTFGEWLAKQPKGTRASLIRGMESEGAVRRAQKGERLGYALASKLSGLTGGKVSIRSLCEGTKEVGNG